MPNSLKLYLIAVLRWWWVIVLGLILPAIDYIGKFGDKLPSVPNWVWWISGILGLIIAQFMAFREVVNNRDELNMKLTEAHKVLDSKPPNEHEGLLLRNLHEFENISIVEDRGVSLANWWKCPNDVDLRIVLGSVHRINNGISVELDLESREIWTYLKQHLADSNLIKVIEDWKAAVASDLIARKNLFDAITKRVAELSKIPVIFDNYKKVDVNRYPWINEIANLLAKIEGEKGKGSHVTWDYIVMIYDEVFCKLVGIKNFPKAFDDFKSGSQGDIYFDNPTQVLIYSNNKEQRDSAVRLLLELETRLVELPEAQIAKSERNKAIEETKNYRREIIITTRLPRNSQCNRCPQ